MKLNKWIVFSSMGFESLVMVLAGLWLGGKLDERVNSQGIWAALGAAIGIGLWFYHLIRVLNRMSESAQESSAESSGEGQQ